MESESESGTRAEPQKPRLADVIGTFIALLTLTLPLWAIAYYSSGNVNIVPGVSYPLPQARE
ncbi:hypothetical protein PJF56_11260 [Roseofilum sp. BLCC_M91]|uniref:Uncharacterized protein n=2 Tax=Roseofilum TaxID=1233426 RepID=A0ABT7B8D9_9CYAN|nr:MULTISPECIES: hypothetical protein [Roseofilum]MDJ1175420.1 hypothetical protein [Roseofilum capinflatum BLCC-M114]MDJ1179441.1 hypothetical protein [Roseofilum halophilum BLCC-M91]